MSARTRRLYRFEETCDPAVDAWEQAIRAARDPAIAAAAIRRYVGQPPRRSPEWLGGELADAVGLTKTPGNAEITTGVARDLIAHALATNLVYRVPMVASELAANLAGRFVECFAEDARFFTNAHAARHGIGGRNAETFDGAGVWAFDSERAGVVYIIDVD